MHEYLTYYSPSTDTYIHLGAKYGSSIMMNNLRDYTAKYSSKNDKISGFPNYGVVSKSFTVKWYNHNNGGFLTECRRAFHNMIDQDIANGTKGRLYFEGRFYMNCFIHAESMGNYLTDPNYAISKFSVITDDPFFYKDTVVDGDIPVYSSSGIGVLTNAVSGCVGIDLKVKYTTTAQGTPLLKLRWKNSNNIVDTSHGLASHSMSSGTVIELDTHDKTVYDKTGSTPVNLFRYRYKTGDGCFYTPIGNYSSLFKSSNSSDITVNRTEIRTIYRTVPHMYDKIGKPLSSNATYGPSSDPGWV